MRIIRAKTGQAMCTAGERRSRQKKYRGLECACTTLGAGGWGLGGMVQGEWEELREEGLALEGREAWSSGH